MTTTARRTVLVVAAAALVLAGCSGQRPTVDPAPASTPTDAAAWAAADTDTCATWTGRRFKGGGDPVQANSARATWAAVLIYEASGRLLGDTNPGDPDYPEAVQMANRLSLYCAGRPADRLVAATRVVLAAQS